MGTPAPLEHWTTTLADRLAEELEVDPAVLRDVNVKLLLDVARDAAHHVVRPAAPITTFLVGYAAGCGGGGKDALARAARVAIDLAAEWGADEPPA